MLTRGIRGAITIEENAVDAIKVATVELLSEILNANAVNTEDISHVIFSLTSDLNAAFPAKFAREELNFDTVPMECYQELHVEPSLRKCLRVMMVVNTEKSQKEIKHIYLKGAKSLRCDITR